MKSTLRILGLLNIAIALLCCASNHAYAVGATTPFTTYEGEAGTLAGGASVVTYTPVNNGLSSAALEASGHAYVQLTATKQSLTWTNTTGKSITFLNIRFCTPDAANGGGTTATLDLYVNGTMRQAITLNSSKEWEYETNINSDGNSKTPGSGLSPHIFWDESHFFITGAAIANGSTIMLKKDSTNTGAFYYIDCIDLEAPPAALTQPANSLSITSYGAVANSPTTDSTTAIQNCFNACQTQGKIAWIPSGTFYLNSSTSLSPTGITIEGAGMWYSEIYASVNDGNILQPFSCTVENILFDSYATGTAAGQGGLNIKGSNWLVNSVWVQHMGAAFWCAGVNGTVENCRMNSLLADGINFNVGNGENAYGLIATNNFIRGSGDDGIAVQFDNINPVVTNNTVVAPRWASGVSIYGGVNDLVSNNLSTDSVNGWGLGLHTFSDWGTFQSALVTGNTVLRAGDVGGTAAIQIGQQQADTEGIVFANNIISNSVGTGISVQGSLESAVENNTISSPGNYGIYVSAGTIGNGVFGNNTITGVPSGYSATSNASPSTFTMITGISASSYSNESSVQTESCAEGGLDVGYISNGSYTEYKSINLTGMTVFQARVACPGGGSTITIHTGSATGTVIGTMTLPVTGGYQNWATVNCNLSGASGTQNVYLVYTSGMNIEWLNFQPNIGGTAINLPVNGELINLVNAASGMALDNGGSTSNGSGVTQWTLQSGNTNQEWETVNVGSGYYNLICQTSGLALDNEGSTSAGTSLWQWSQQANNSNQEWEFILLSNNDYNLVCLQSGMALDNGGSTSNGSAVVQDPLNEVPYPYQSGSPEQEWQVEAISQPLQNGGVYNVMCQTSGMVLDNGSGNSNGTPTIQYSLQSGNTNQEWELVSAGNGYYNLICQTSGDALDNEGSTTAGSGVWQWTPQSSNTNQEWEPVSVGGGNYNLICLTSGMALDNGGSTSVLTDIIQEPVQSGDTNQEWSFDLIGN